MTSVPRFGLPSTIGAGPTTFSGATASPWAKSNDVLQPVAPDAQHERRRQRVDDRDADAVQAARNLVGVLVELSAGVQLGHDDLGRRDALLFVDAGRNAAPVVGDGARAVGVEGHGHELGMPGQRLVDRVVDDLVDHVVEAGAVVGVADIHARPLAHRVEAAQHLDRIRAVAFAGGLAVVGQVLAFFVQNQSLFVICWRGRRAPICATATLTCQARRCTFPRAPRHLRRASMRHPTYWVSTGFFKVPAAVLKPRRRAPSRARCAPRRATAPGRWRSSTAGSRARASRGRPRRRNRTLPRISRAPWPARRRAALRS